MARYELTEFEWKVIQAATAQQASRGAAGIRPAVSERDFLGFAFWFALG